MSLLNRIFYICIWSNFTIIHNHIFSVASFAKIPTVFNCNRIRIYSSVKRIYQITFKKLMILKLCEKDLAFFTMRLFVSIPKNTKFSRQFCVKNAFDFMMPDPKENRQCCH